jgi:DNA-binding transcriptional MerR regulator
MFSEAEAARLLRVAQSTLHYWLEGGERRGRTYQPVIRVEPRGTRSVTWAEFIEAGLLRQYRREHGVPMAELRAFIDLLREGTGIP